MRTKAVEFYYDFSSTNSYFAAFLTPELCRRTGAELRWMPFYLGHAFRLNNHSLDKEPRAKLAYFWRDHQRWAKRTSLPFRMPSRFPIKSSQALRGAVALPPLEVRHRERSVDRGVERDRDDHEIQLQTWCAVRPA